jgi:hypothetical protein
VVEAVIDTTGRVEEGSIRVRFSFQIPVDFRLPSRR